MMADGDESATRDGSNTETAREEPDVEHTNVFFTGALPRPTGTVAASIAAKSTTREQSRQMASFYEFLATPNPNFASVNHDTVCRVFLLGMPKSRNVRVIHSLGFDINPPGEDGPLANSFLAMHGNGNAEAGPPNAIIFPKSSANPRDVRAATQNQLSSMLSSKAPNFTYPLIPSASVNTNPRRMQRQKRF
jgi:hypothetical protein